MARARTRPGTPETINNPQPSPAPSLKIDEEDVARRAYDLYLARGSAPGHDVDDWLQAERELHATKE